MNSSLTHLVTCCIHHPEIAQREEQQQGLEKEQVAVPVPGVAHHIAGAVSIDILFQRAGRVELPFGELHAVIAHGGLHGILIIGLIAIVVIAALALLGPKVKQKFEQINNELDKATSPA